MTILPKLLEHSPPVDDEKQDGTCVLTRTPALIFSSWFNPFEKYQSNLIIFPKIWVIKLKISETITCARVDQLPILRINSSQH